MDRRIEVAIKIMQADRAHSLPISEIARHVHLSPWHFIRLFKAETSVSPKRYLHQLKLKRAEELLGESFLSVKEVAANLGFGDRSNFSREFKKMSGLTPSEFRIHGKSGSDAA
jgi:transcriptional regulator GlxA family with amidase domain